jgi:hypothetical protein
MSHSLASDHTDTDTDTDTDTFADKRLIFLFCPKNGPNSKVRTETSKLTIRAQNNFFILFCKKQAYLSQIFSIEHTTKKRRDSR